MNSNDVVGTTSPAQTNINEPLHVFTVLNTKAWHPDPNRIYAYKPEHVIWMVNQLLPYIKASSLSCHFYCLSDVPIPELDNAPYATVLPLRHPEFKGWWSKLELFRPDIANEHYAPRNVFIDLDTIFARNPLEILKHIPSDPNNLMMLRNMSTPYNPDGSSRAGSGVMGWRGGSSASERLQQLYHLFLSRFEYYMEQHKSAHSWGDQGFISTQFPDAPSSYGLEYYQDTFPDQIHAFVADLDYGPPKETTRIVCMNGLPKPWGKSKVRVF